MTESYEAKEDEFFTYTPICENGWWWVLKSPKTIQQREAEWKEGKWKDGNRKIVIKNSEI